MRDVSGAQVGVGINGAGHAAVDGGKLSEDIRRSPAARGGWGHISMSVRLYTHTPRARRGPGGVETEGHFDLHTQKSTHFCGFPSVTVY